MLVVEDDPANARLIAALLAADGRTNVRIAHSAEEALDVISTAPVRALIVDIGLPGMSGLALVDRVKTDASTCHIVAIAVTANDATGIEGDAMRRGCAGFMQKPIDGDRLLRLLSAGLAEQDSREPHPGLPMMNWRPEDNAAMHPALSDRSFECATGRPAEHFDAYFNAAPELLAAMVDVLDVRTAVPRLSEILQKVLPHDALTVAASAADGALIEAVSPAGFPDVAWQEFMAALADDLIVGDLITEPLPLSDAVNPTRSLVAAGYRSVLSLSTRAGDQAVTIGFWAKRPQAYDRPDLPLARRIAGHLAVAVSHEQLARRARPARENRECAERFEARVPMSSRESGTDDRIIGHSPEWQHVLRKATQVAATDTTVLISGESGTGKEVIARFIHRASARKRGRFVAVNCAALPEQLLESELFGYERGAFTGAQQAKPGQIELGAGGVLFLDEVSEMSLSAQAKFLRVLQEREFKRLGGTRSLRADVRVIAATNRNLRKAVEEGDFREDLYYRLQVFDIEIPPLRLRRMDILPLSEAFLKEIGHSMGRPPAGLTREAHEALLRHDWPGNVRELRNALERAVILCDGGLIEGHHLIRQPASKPIPSPATDLNSLERDMMARVLDECNWKKTSAARRLGLSRTQLYSRMRKHGLDRPD